jgi:hypothetical protein
MGTTTTNIKPRTPAMTQKASTSTPRVSDLDVLMAEKHVNTKIVPSVELKSTDKRKIISPSPLVNNIRRSLFSTDAVKVVRPVRSQELKIFSSHLITESTPVIDEVSCQSNIDETLSTLTPSTERKADKKSFDNQTMDKNDDLSSNTSVLIRNLSEDSLNEHHHIRQLLQSSKLSLFKKRE